MTRTVDMLMPQAGSAYEAVAAEYFEPYRLAFAAVGIVVTACPWDQAAGGSNTTLALFAWGYHLDVARWDAVWRGWPTDRPLFNIPTLLAWNTRKTYLLELEAVGVPIVPSRFGHVDADAVAAACTAFGCDALVMKPQISAGSHDTIRVQAGDRVAKRDAMILQPYLPAVTEEGELSLFAIGGQLSHGVRKRASGGDFRVQPQFGGAVSRYEPDDEALAIFAAVLAALPETPLYARIDLLRRGDGRLSLIEVELIEPDLFVAVEPQVPARLVAALLAAQ